MNTFMRTQDRVKVQNWLASDASDTCEHVARFALCRECDEKVAEEEEAKARALDADDSYWESDEEDS